MDIAKAIRLAHMVRGAAEGTDPKGLAADALMNLWRQVIAAVDADVGPDDELRGEFETLFRSSETMEVEQYTPPPPTTVLGYDPVAAENRAYKAHALLLSLAGWLEGIVAQARAREELMANAQAYAEAKVKADRGIGFRAPEG